MSVTISWKTADKIINIIKDKIDKKAIGVGSYRRESSIMKDIDIITTTPLNDVRDKFADNFYISEILSDGEMKKSFIFRYRSKLIHIDFFKTTKKELPFALFHWTGNKSFNIRTRAQAKRLGYKLNQHGLFDIKTGKSVLSTSNEKKIFAFLKITYKLPFDRS